MYTLNDITTYDLVFFKKISNELQLLFQKYNITNFQELEWFIQKFPCYYNEEIARLLARAYNTLARISSKEIEIFDWNSNKDNHIKELISKTDSEVLGIQLPYNIASSGGVLKGLALKEINISTIKYLSSKITLDGKNALMKVLYGLGPKNFSGFINKIKFYDEQLERVIPTISSIQGFNGNLFTFRHEEKVRFVEENFDDIFNTLFGLSDNFIFGRVNDEYKKAIINSFHIFFNNPDYRKKSDYIYKYMTLVLIRIIANYTTLQELQSGSTKMVLKRFSK